MDEEIAVQETQGQTGGQGQGQIPEFPDDEDDEALFGDAMEFESQHTQNAQSEKPKEGTEDVAKNSEDVSSNKEDEISTQVGDDVKDGENEDEPMISSQASETF